MPTQVPLHHTTHYRYGRPVLPNPDLRVLPTGGSPNHHLTWQQDPQANFQARLVFPESATEFTVAVDLTADTVAINPFDFFFEPNASQFPFHYDRETANELCAYLGTEQGTEQGAAPAGPKLASFLSENSAGNGRDDGVPGGFEQAGTA
jgi:transglutaminase-like putative cysteine protease